MEHEHLLSALISQFWIYYCKILLIFYFVCHSLGLFWFPLLSPPFHISQYLCLSLIYQVLSFSSFHLLWTSFSRLLWIISISFPLLSVSRHLSLTLSYSDPTHFSPFLCFLSLSSFAPSVFFSPFLSFFRFFLSYLSPLSQHLSFFLVNYLLILYILPFSYSSLIIFHKSSLAPFHPHPSLLPFPHFS